jgi:hypothetical protein
MLRPSLFFRLVRRCVMGILEKIKAKTNDYIKFTDAVEWFAKKEKISINDVAKIFIHYKIDENLPCFFIDSCYVIHSENGFNQPHDEDRIFLNQLEDANFSINSCEVDKEIKEKYDNYFWLKEAFFNFEPVKEINKIETDYQYTSQPHLEYDNSMFVLQDSFSIIEAAALMSGHDPIFIEICWNDTNFNINYKDFLQCKGFIDSAIDFGSLILSNGKIIRKDLALFLVKKGLKVDGLTDEFISEKCSLPTIINTENIGNPAIGHVDSSYYQQQRDLLLVENEQLKQCIAELEKQDYQKSIFDELLNPDNPKYAPDLAHCVNLWHYLYVEKTSSDSHTNRANNWIEANTRYDFSDKGGKASIDRLREIATPFIEWSTHRNRNYKK